MTQGLLGIHDWSPDWAKMVRDAGQTGWCVTTHELGADPNDHSGHDYGELASYGITPLARLNYSHSGQGTIPPADQYEQFARRCANFVANSRGCSHFIIGNEPNFLSVEAPVVDGVRQPILPSDYARCYVLVREAIQDVDPNAHVIVAALAPWNVQTTYPGNDQASSGDKAGDWLQYWTDMLEAIDARCDGLALHTYTHAADPALITSTATMNPPYQDRYFHFLAYQDFLLEVPMWARTLPTYVVETDQDVPWTDTNDGWIQKAAMEIDAWNATAGTQKIQCLCCYRWAGDQWALAGKQRRLADFAAALALGISSPGLTPPVEPSTPPTAPPESPVTSPPSPVLDWDTRLDARGVVLVRSSAEPGQAVYRVVEGRWFDEQESQGRHHTYVDVVEEGDQRAVALPIQWGWADSMTQKFAENKTDPWLTAQGIDGCAADFPMEHTAPTYWTAPEGLGDRVEGLGLGDLTRPGMTIHTSYYFRWQRVTETEPDPSPPEPEPEPDRDVVHPLPGAVITQHWGQSCPEYAPGIWGHNGTDLGGMIAGTPIGSIAEGVVAYADWDEGGYGFYVRIFHEHLGVHSFYSHLMEAADVGVGQIVAAGSTIGFVGSTGNSTAAHLHLEIRQANPDGSYDEACAPMPKGRIDPETFFALHGVKL